VLCLHGLPRSIFSDRGSEFVNRVLSELCSVYGIKQSFTAGYSANANGVCERQIQNIIGALRSSINNTGANWSALLPQITFNLNTSVSKATQHSPYFLIFGRKPKNLSLLHEIDTITANKAPVLEQIIQGQTLGQQIAFDQTNDFEDINRQRINATRPRSCNVKIGDFVYLYKPAINENDNQKLTARYTGPMLVSDILSRGNCQLKDPVTMKIYPYNVQVSRLNLAKDLKEA
jgi:glycosylphosphatidylinositol phospholipase D